MKSKKLYTKIFLSFLGVIFVTEILILVLFIAVPGRYFKNRLKLLDQARVVLIQEAVENQFRKGNNAPIEKNRKLADFVRSFAHTIDATIWITDSRGRVLLKSADDLPDLARMVEDTKVHHVGKLMLYRRHGIEILNEIPLTFPDGSSGQIHVLLPKPLIEHPEGRFMTGLLVIGVIVALLVIPVSRQITKPLNRLRRSAMHIADGDLSQRAVISSRDEIGELCSAFNHMADRVERMIRGGRELTANISHELRTPLTRIRIAEEMLREKLECGITSGLERHLQSIREDIEELDRLIGRILNLSKLDIHEVPLQKETFDPEALLRELIHRQETILDSKKLTLKQDFFFASSFVGDKEALSSLFAIVLDNALKFTPEGGEISVETSATPGAMRICFSNSFAPMDPEQLEKIFTPFYRTQETDAKGTGIGLAIAKKIVERHKGTIVAKNTEKGLSVIIHLPLEE